MTAQTPVLTSFNGGELSPLMAGRVDTSIYPIAAEAMENFVPAIEGPMQKCPGFRRIRAAAESATWLGRFVFNNVQAYAIEGSEGKARFYTGGGRIESGPTAPYEVTVPFTGAEWPFVSTQQSYDRLYTAHASHPPGALSRLTGTTFGFADLALKSGPFKDGNSDKTVTVIASGTLTEGGTVTLTASADLFLDTPGAGHAGGLFQLEALDFSDVPAWEVGIDSNTAGVTIRRSDGKVYIAASTGRTGTVQPTHEEGTEYDGSASGTDINGKGPYGVQWTYLYDRFGIVRIDTVTSPTVATGTVLRRLPDSLASVASWRWALGAFSDAEGWPNLVFIRDQRLCFWKRFERYASVVGDYYNFQQFTSGGFLADDLAFRLTLDAPDPPLWVTIDREEIIGTASGEYAVGAVNAAAGITATNISSRKQSAYGVAPVWPVEPGTSIVYAQRGGTQMREAQYDFGRDRYLSSNINRWARHIFGSGMVQLGQQQLTEELLFAVRRDGQMVLRSFDPEQEVKGFSRRILGQGGKVISAVCVPSADGYSDELYALCEWDGARSVQIMGAWWKPGDDVTEAFFVDDGLSDSLMAPSATVSGLDHLVGATVSILADGGVVEPMVVPAGGIITLPYAASKRVVGRGYTARMKTMRLEARDPTGQSVQGKRKRIVNVILRLLDTWGIKLNAGERDELVLDRPIGAPLDAAAPLFTGDSSAKSLTGGWSRDGQFEIISDVPLPAFVIAAMPRMEASTQ